MWLSHSQVWLSHSPVWLSHLISVTVPCISGTDFAWTVLIQMAPHTRGLTVHWHINACINCHCTSVVSGKMAAKGSPASMHAAACQAKSFFFLHREKNKRWLFGHFKGVESERDEFFWQSLSLFNSWSIKQNWSKWTTSQSESNVEELCLMSLTTYT